MRMSNNPHFEAVRARALEMLRTSIAPSDLAELCERSDRWALKNKVAVAVIQACDDARFTKTDKAKAQKEVINTLLCGQ